MPVGSVVVKRLAEQGLDEDFLEGSLRTLRLAGLLPAGKRGGGKASVHWQATDYAKFIPSLAANGPTSAADAVAAIFLLPYCRSFTGSIHSSIGEVDEAVQLDCTFGEYLVRDIYDLARSSPEQKAERMQSISAATIIMSANPPRAEISFYDRERHFTLLWQRPLPPAKEGENALMAGYAHRPRLWTGRTTSVPYEIIAACAELLAMNPETTSAGQSTGEPPSGGASADVVTATATNENAPSLPGPRASTRNSQPRANATETLHTSEAREDGKSHQVPFGMRGWLPIQPRQDRSQHALHFA